MPALIVVPSGRLPDHAVRIPVETVACDLSEYWKDLGVATDFATVAFASWVDNYFAIDSYLVNVVAIAESFERELQARWSLRIRPGSCSVLSPGPEDADTIDFTKWPTH